MKKNLLLIVFALASFSPSSFAHDQEIYVLNCTGHLIYAKFYPVGSLVNGPDNNGNRYYSLKTYKEGGWSRAGLETDPPLFHIVGLDGWALSHRGPYPGLFEIPTSSCTNIGAALKLGADAVPPSYISDGLFGYGHYILDFSIPADDGELVSVATIPFDYMDQGYGIGGANADVFIKVYSSTNITFEWAEVDGDEIDLYDSRLPVEDRGNIKCYRQYRRYVGTGGNCGNNGEWQCFSFTPVVPTALSDPDPAFRNYPLNGAQLPSPYTIPIHVTPGKLFANLRIQSGHTANILNDKTMSVEAGAFLDVWTGATLQFGTNCTLDVRTGGGFCNYGTIIGNGNNGSRIIYRRGWISACRFGVFNNAQIILQDSAIVDVADSSEFILDSNSVLIMNPNSELRFGKNAKIILKNGSRIFADHAKFTSLYADSTWDGIYLYGISQDTIKYCTIENAYSGISIIDKYSMTPASYSAEISNCTFSNTTATRLKTAVYVSNSNNVLVRNNTLSSSQLVNGFDYGVSLSYCPAGNIDILDNTINKALTGIKSVQSSPYIARNSITGQSGSNYGFYLDNANGIIKYNIVSNFTNSLYALYSSPYLLKNTFQDATSRNMELNSNSIPVMRPLNSGSELSWIAGDNRFTGSPTYSAMNFINDSYPVMDSGYNRIALSSGDYMNGTVPSSQPSGLKATYNYWGSSTPSSSKFNVTGTVIYDPWLSSPGTPATDYYDLNDIGFGLKDTVYIEDLGDNPGASNLFAQAYRNEMLGEFLSAIAGYKYVITTYRNSTYAALSLSRIINCAEKKRYSNTEYSLLGTYFNAIRIGSLYNREMRELAEDFIIKCKVRRGMLNDAIDDYDAMYQQNLNNSKGVHALLNKLALIAMRDGSGQMPFGNPGNYTSNNSILNLSVPNEYKLEQNYPNPFNPVTTIKYETPKDGNVLLKIYDILGREVYSMNEFKKAGSYELIVNGENLASGLYYYRIEAEGFIETKKMVLIK